MKRVEKKTGRMKTAILFFIVVVLIALPFWLHQGREFEGSDDAAVKAIVEIDKDYKPWFQPLWRPPGKNMESLLFALQATIGAGFIGYYLGLSAGKSKK